MPKYKQGDSIFWPDFPQGWRLVLGVEAIQYRVSPFYELATGQVKVDDEGPRTLDISFVDRHYLAVGAGGDEKAAPDTAEVERLSAEVTSLNARLNSAVALNQKYGSDAERIGQGLIEEAERRDWCSDFDGWVDDMNGRLSVIELPTRARDYDVELTYTVTIHATVNACDASSAVDEAYEAFDEPSEVRYHQASWDFQSGDASES